MDRRKKIYELVLFSILTTIIIVMSFTPVGYIKTLGVEITLLVIPVAVGAILLGPIYGACLGFIFGLTSFLQCVFGFSAFGATLLSINWFYSLIVCLIPRILMGLITGLIFKVLKTKLKDGITPYIISCIVAALSNTILFTSLLCICFYHTDFVQSIVVSLGASNVFVFAILFVGVNGLVEAIVNAIIGVGVSKVLKQTVFK